MKKLLSIMLAVLMTASVLTVAAAPVYAVVSPSAPVIDRDAEPELEVNGTTTTTDITYAPDENDDTTITFTYTGDGELTGWEDNLDELGLEENVDYTAVMNPDGTYTIHFITPAAINVWNNEKVVVNAIVKFPTDETTTAKPNESGKSPKTGAITAVVASGVAAAAAGYTVLKASKKREED